MTRQFTRRGNLVQWANGQPGRKLIGADIRAGHCYLIIEGGETAGVFCFLCGKDVEPSCAAIDGAWLDDGPYGVLHRLPYQKLT